MTDAAPESSVSPDPSTEPPAGDGTAEEDVVVDAAEDDSAEEADDSEDEGADEDVAAEDDEDDDEDDDEYDLEDESDIAADYLEGLLDIADLDGDIDMDVDGNRATVAVVGEELDDLVGEDGHVLDALQELTRLAVQQQTGERSRLMLDVGGFRANRRKELTDLATDAIEEVKRTGESKRLAPMTPFERKCVHDVVAGAGLVSESEGEEPHRRVVVLPA